LKLDTKIVTVELGNKEGGLRVNAEKTKYMLLSHNQNAGQNHDMMIGNRCSENVAQFRYLGMTITNQNLIQEEIERRLNAGNACYNQNAGQNHDMKIGNRCSENVAQFRYVGTTITNQNLIQEEIEKRLNVGNACYHSVQKCNFACGSVWV
jgi:ribosomal protein S2